VDFPSVASTGAHLPAVAPTPGGEIDPFGASAPPPAPHDPFPHHAGGNEAGFGEVELPGPGAAPTSDAFGELELEAPPSKPRAPVGDGFGDLDIPTSNPPHAASASAGGPLMIDAQDAGAPISAPSREAKTGGMGFGEVDLPGGGDDDMEFGAIPQAEAPHSGPGTAELPNEGGQEYEAPLPRTPEARGAPAAQPEKKKSKVGWVLLAIFGVAMIAGGALETTKYGAFGRFYIIDRLNADKYALSTNAAVQRTREAFSMDATSNAALALTQLDADVKIAPRHGPLLAYSAYANFADEIRFGKSGQYDSLGNRLLTQVTEPNPYKRLAEAARDVVAGNLPNARATLQSLLTGDTTLDAAVTLGELEIRDKKPKDAITAFQLAKKTEDSARTRAGLMRAFDASGDSESATKEAMSIVSDKRYPTHVPSRLLLARYAWDKKDEKGTLKWLDEIDKMQGAASPAEQVDAFTLRGDLLLDRNHITDAREAYRKAQAAAASGGSGMTAPLALLGQGEVDMASGQYAAAISDFNQASQAQPDLTQAKIGVARAKLKQELPADAKQVLLALKDAKRAGEIGYWLGQAEEKLEPDKPAEAMKIYQDAIKAQPTEVKSYIALAKLQARVGKPDEAAGTLAEALKAVPPSDKLFVSVGQLKYQQGKYDDALEQFDRALGLQPENLEALFEKGRTLLRIQARIDEGKTVLEDVEKKDPKYPGLALEFGYYYLHTNQLAEALKKYQSALDEAPDNADVKLNVGIAMVESGNPDAEQTLRDVLDKCQAQSASPDSCTVEAKHYLGRALLIKGSFADALVFLKQAVEKGDANASYHLFYGEALYEMGRYDDADLEVNRTLELDKSKSDAYWMRAEILSRRSQFKDAIAAANEALKQNANLVAAHATIAYSMHELGNDGDALNEYRKAIDADPTNRHAAWWRYEFADISYHAGRIGNAIKDLKLSIDAASALATPPPWLPKAYFYLGEALKHSDKAAATTAYKTFLDKTVGSTDPARGDAKSALFELGAPYAGP
jgi:tetratricopeptide (TPR) repeat protein